MATKKTKIILLTDVPNVGKRLQVRDVSAGYARNYLVPSGLARLASTEALAEIDTLRAKEDEKAKKELAETQDLASRLDGTEVEISTKISPKGESYSAISSANIAESLREIGFEISKSAIKIPEPIKKVGEHNVVIEHKYGLESNIKVIVSEDTQETKKDPK